jgi:HlyD family secretion protein
MKNIWKKLLLAAFGLAILAMIVLAFLPKPIIVETAHVRHGTLQVTLDAEGKTRVHDLYLVAAPVTGRLGRIDIEEGDHVSSGAPIAVISSPSLDPLQRDEQEHRIASVEANHRQSVAGVEAVSVRLDQARREYERMKQVEAVGAVSHQELERAASAVDVATKEMKSAESQAQAAASQVEAAKAPRTAYPDRDQSHNRIVLRAPAEGKILRVIDRGERIVPAGSPILQIGDPSGLEIVIDVLSSDAVKIERGTPILVEGWGGERALAARVMYVEPSAFTRVSALGVEEQRVNVIAEFTEPTTKIGDGFRVNARIILWEGASLLIVPTSALFRVGNGWSLFVVREGKAHRVPVEIGRMNSFDAQVLGGVGEGDEVIVHPPDKVDDGARVDASDISSISRNQEK